MYAYKYIVTMVERDKLYRLTTDIIVDSEYNDIRYAVDHNVHLSVGPPMCKL